ncbi:MAG: TolC family protein [Chryseolinea sp.]
MKRNIFAAIAVLICICSQAIAQTDEVSLEEVIALALEQNYDVRLFKNSATTAATDDKFSIGGLIPVITTNGSRTWNSNDQKQTLADQSKVERNGIRTNNLTANVQATWLLFDGLRMFATRERLDQIAQQGELNVKNQMVNTIANVIVNYHDVVRQKQQLKAIREQLAVSEERVRLADRRLSVGTGAKPELLQAKVDMNAQRTAILQQQTTIQQVKDQLNGLVNNQLPPVYDVADTIIINLELRQEEIADNIENSSFSLQSFKKSTEIATLVLRERKGERYPFINAIGSYNFSRAENSLVINNFTTLFNQNLGLNYGFNFSFPIVNGLINRRNIQQARITVDRTRLLYDQAKTNINVGVKNAYTSYDNAKKILLVEEENIGLARENLYIALEIFKRSANTFIEVRTAQQSLADAYNRLINARYVAKVAETQLLQLNGSLLRNTPNK